MRTLLHSMGGIPLVLILLALFFQEVDPNGAASAIQNFGFDRYIAGSPWSETQESDPSRPSLVYVELDTPNQPDTRTTGWSRERLAQLIGKLKNAGAQAVILDQPFAQSAAGSPNQFADALEKKNASTEVTRALRLMDDPDEILANALSAVPTISAIELNVDGPALDQAPESYVTVEGAPPQQFLRRHNGAYSDRADFAATANGVGIVSIPASPNGVVRTVPLIHSVGQLLLPGISLETIRFLADARITVHSRSREEAFWSFNAPGIHHIVAGDRHIPTTESGSLWLHPPGPSSNESLVGSSILNGKIDPQSLNNTVIFIGSTPAKKSPYRLVDGNRLSLAQIHMLAFDQIISGQFIHRPFWVVKSEQLYIVVFGLMIWAAAVYLSLSLSAVITSIGIALPAYFGLVIFQSEFLLVDFIIPCTTLIFIFATTAGWQAAHNEWVNQLTGGPEKRPGQAVLKIKNAHSVYQDTTVMVCSVRNMGALTDLYQGSPFAVGTVVETVFARVATTVAHHGGQLRHRGDTLLAIWSNAEDSQASATNACECALELVEKLEVLNNRLEKDFSYEGLSFDPITLNLGIASGPCVIARSKKAKRSQSSVFGAPVTVASILCQRAERYGPAIIVDEMTPKLEGHQLAHLPVDIAREMPSTEPMQIYALLGNAFMRANPRFKNINQKHQQLFAAIRGRLWEEAETINNECRDLPGASLPLYEFYGEKISRNEGFGAASTT